jgi:hypothetical protein
MTPELTHFLRLAHRGLDGHGASGGEQRAARLARTVVEELPGLDPEATLGLSDFVCLTATDPQEARALLDSS